MQQTINCIIMTFKRNGLKPVSLTIPYLIDQSIETLKRLPPVYSDAVELEAFVIKDVGSSYSLETADCSLNVYSDAANFVDKVVLTVNPYKPMHDDRIVAVIRILLARLDYFSIADHEGNTLTGEQVTKKLRTILPA